MVKFFPLTATDATGRPFVVNDQAGKPILVPIELILHPTEKDEDGIATAIKSAIVNQAKYLGVNLSDFNLGAAKPFGMAPLHPEMLGRGDAWVFRGGTGSQVANAGTWNTIVSSAKVQRDTRVVIYGIANKSPSPQFTAIQFTVDGDTQPLLEIERIKDFGLNTPFGREAYFPRDLILEVGGNRRISLDVFTTGTDNENFQILGVQIAPRNVAINKNPIGIT